MKSYTETRCKTRNQHGIPDYKCKHWSESLLCIYTSVICIPEIQKYYTYWLRQKGRYEF